MMLVRMMSAGIRSGVNWMRENDSSRLSESVLMSSVCRARDALEKQ